MRRTLALAELTAAALVATWIAAVGASADVGCPQSAADWRPKLSITVRDPQPRLDHSKTLAEIGQLARRARNVHGGASVTTGLTVVSGLATRLGMRASIVRGTYGHCARPSEIELTIGFDAIDVYVANRYPPGSCQYLAVLEHENGHAGIAKAVLALRVKDVRARLEREASNWISVPTSNPQDAADAANRRLGAALQEEVERMGREMKDRNAKHDSPESYGRTMRQCNPW